MFQGEAIRDLVYLLQDRGAYLYHACHLVDFRSYLEQGGIPSRGLLESARLPFTPFETDASDRERGLWHHVFVNLDDFGRGYAAGHPAVPNPYGPILLVVRAEALFAAEDVAVCLRSAGELDYDRQREALTSTAEVERLFKYSRAEGRPRSSYVKGRAELERDFPGARGPEVSCTVPGQQLSLEHVTLARVDPYALRGTQLKHVVDRIAGDHGVGFQAYLRDCLPERAAVLNELAEIVVPQVPVLGTLARATELSEELRTWADELRRRGLEWQFRRFATYLREGTVLPLLRRDGLLRLAS